jgi:hypothetical protein
MQTAKIKNTFIKTIVAVVFVSLMPSLAMAHHSSSEFTNARVELEGTLLQVSWRNPHPSLTFQLASTGELWNIQIPGTIESLAANNITANSFETGQNINIAGLISTRIDNYIQCTHVLFSNGEELILKQGLQPLWTQATETISQATITNNVIIIEEPINPAFNYKWLLSFSIIAGLLSICGLITFRNNKFKAAL